MCTISHCAPFRIACSFCGKFIGFGKLYIMRIIRTLTVGILMVLALNSASAETAAKAKKFDWRPVMDAITQVESKGNAKAVNGPHAGILQISHHVVAECNNILKAKGRQGNVTQWQTVSVPKNRERCLFCFNQNITRQTMQSEPFVCGMAE